MKSATRVIDVSTPPTVRLLRACAAFGLALRHTADHARAPRRAQARRILDALAPGQIALITGPSGGGKSSLLADIAQEAARRREPILPLPRPAREAPIIDLIPGPLAEAIATLARAGLGDATLLARTPAELSEGERFRFRLALAMSKAEPRPPGSDWKRELPEPCAAPLLHGRGSLTLLIDEFASTLDRTTARCLCLAMRRWLSRAQRDGQLIRIITATAHHDIARWLEPDMTIVVPLGGAPLMSSRPIAPASIRHLARQSPWRPQSAIRIRRAA